MFLKNLFVMVFEFIRNEPSAYSRQASILQYHQIDVNDSDSMQKMKFLRKHYEKKFCFI